MAESVSMSMRDAILLFKGARLDSLMTEIPLGPILDPYSLMHT
jgi:hypothetical protein